MKKEKNKIKKVKISVGGKVINCNGKHTWDELNSNLP